MSQDKSDIQVIEKFSFIYTLTHSRDKNTHSLEKKVSVDVQKCRDKPDRDPCHEIIHSSSDSVTLSSILGFPNLAATNSLGLSLLDESSVPYFLDLPEQPELSAGDNRSGDFILRHLGKIVFVLSSGYFIFVACWLVGHNYYGKLFPFSALRTVFNISEQQISAADLEFIDYMERSLASIESRQAAEVNHVATSENSAPVYIPVYNLTNINSASPTHNPQATFPFNSSANNSSLPIPLIPPPPPIKLPPSTFTSPSINTTPSTNTTTSRSAAPPFTTNTKPSPSSNTSPTKDYTLIGIVELGKRSAALFKVDGATKRIWVGEKLDHKGWILDSVTNQKAKMVRQGTIRYLSVGEKF